MEPESENHEKASVTDNLKRSWPKMLGLLVVVVAVQFVPKWLASSPSKSDGAKAFAGNAAQKTTQRQSLDGSWRCGPSKNAVTFEGQNYVEQILYGEFAGGAEWGIFDFADGKFRKQTQKVRSMVNDPVLRNQLVQSLARQGNMRSAQTLMQNGYFEAPADYLGVYNVMRLDAKIFEYEIVESYKNGVQQPLVGPRITHCERE